MRQLRKTGKLHDAGFGNGSPGGFSQNNWVGVCGPLPNYDQNLPFSSPIYELTKNLIPYSWPLRLAQLPQTQFMKGFG